MDENNSPYQEKIIEQKKENKRRKNQGKYNEGQCSLELFEVQITLEKILNG